MARARCANCRRPLNSRHRGRLPSAMPWKLVRTTAARMRRNGKVVDKHHLPSKLCRHCGRPFNWRKKWARCWESVAYCSQACRRQRSVVP
ncbi:MAG: DUF2256 domain-containing protein [Opitutales bacterium]